MTITSWLLMALGAVLMVFLLRAFFPNTGTGCDGGACRVDGGR